MSGAQGAQPPGSFTATTYESVPGGENCTRAGLRYREDEGYIQVNKKQDKVKAAAGEGGPIFGAGKEEGPDLGVTGMAGNAGWRASLVGFLRVFNKIVNGDIIQVIGFVLFKNKKRIKQKKDCVLHLL